MCVVIKFVHISIIKTHTEKKNVEMEISLSEFPLILIRS
jgi:hypothetical protein